LALLDYTMPKIIFNVSDELMKQIERVIKKWSFESCAEFFCFTAIDFIRNEA